MLRSVKLVRVSLPYRSFSSSASLRNPALRLLCNHHHHYQQQFSFHSTSLCATSPHTSVSSSPTATATATKTETNTNTNTTLPPPSANKEDSSNQSEIPEGSKFKRLWKKYGVIAVATYLGVYVITLGGMYVAVSTHAFGSDIAGWLRKRGFDKYVDTNLLSSKAGNFTVAWVLTKFTEPLRLALTVALVPSLARVVGRRTAARTLTSMATSHASPLSVTKPKTQEGTQAGSSTASDSGKSSKQ